MTTYAECTLDGLLFFNENMFTETLVNHGKEDVCQSAAN